MTRLSSKWISLFNSKSTLHSDKYFLKHTGANLVNELFFHFALWIDRHKPCDACMDSVFNLMIRYRLDTSWTGKMSGATVTQEKEKGSVAQCSTGWFKINFLECTRKKKSSLSHSFHASLKLSPVKVEINFIQLFLAMIYMSCCWLICHFHVSLMRQRSSNWDNEFGQQERWNVE